MVTGHVRISASLGVRAAASVLMRSCWHSCRPSVSRYNRCAATALRECVFNNVDMAASRTTSLLVTDIRCNVTDVTGNRDADQERQRDQAAERARRYRARLRGEKVPAKKPGPAPRTPKDKDAELKQLRREVKELKQRIKELEAANREAAK